MCASQALTFRKECSSDFIESLLLSYRQEVDFVSEDRVLYDDMQKSLSFLQNLEVDKELLF